MKRNIHILVLFSVFLLVTGAPFSAEFENESDQPFRSAGSPNATLEIVAGGINGSALHITGNSESPTTAYWPITGFDSKAFSFWIKLATKSRVDIKVYQESQYAWQYAFLADGNMSLWENGFSRLAEPMLYELNKWYLIEVYYPNSDYKNQYIKYYVNGVMKTGSGYYRPWNTIEILLDPGAEIYVDSWNMGCPSGCHGYECDYGTTYEPCSCYNDPNAGGLSCSPQTNVVVSEANPTFSAQSPLGLISNTRVNYSLLDTGLKIIITADTNISLSYSFEGVLYSEQYPTGSFLTYELPIGSCVGKNILLLSIWSPDFAPFSYNWTVSKIVPQRPLPNGKTVDLKDGYDPYFALTGNGPFTTQYTISEITGEYLIFYYGTELCNLTSYKYLDKDDAPWSVSESYATPQEIWFKLSGSAKMSITVSNCDSTKCGGRGVCYNDKCDCFDFYTGETCEINLCRYSNCGIHGTCVLLPNHGEQCVCDEKWAGYNCDCYADKNLNVDTISNVQPTSLNTTAYLIDSSEFPNGFAVTLQSSNPSNFKIASDQQCNPNLVSWDDGPTTRRIRCAGYPWTPKPSPKYYLVLVQNLNVFSSYSLVVADAGPVGTPLIDGFAMNGEYIRNYDSNYGPSVRNYTVDVPEGKGVKIQVTVTTQPSSTTNIYSKIEIYGSNYTCANDKGNAFVHVTGLTKDITIQANCVTDGKFFITIYNYWQNDIKYNIIASTFNSGSKCEGPTGGPNPTPTPPAGPTKLVITLNADCSTLNLTAIKSKIEELVNANVMVTSDCAKREVTPVHVTVTMANNAHITEKQAQEVKTALQTAGYDIQGFQIIDPMPEPGSSTSTSNDNKSSASSLAFSCFPLLWLLVFTLF
eukprot:Phypoly_transcript_02869.p1 GENE.Phypoly_transcript_02869~~Phypoly_transcript_02869.p1  ORF type:complete len:865 (+),score=95.56 Phypoly_transcript_02869:38-2632(+)